jgi:hypothetical protein
MTIDIAVSALPAEALTEPEFVPNLDDLIGPAKCSCSAGDDTPY